MKYRVEWLSSAEQVLASLFLEAIDPRAITAASNAIDRQLERDPLYWSTPLDHYYFLRIDPLVVLCEIRPDELLVQVIEVQLLRTD